MISIFYRYCPINNQAPRPTWFSKEACMHSFLSSYKNFIMHNKSNLIRFNLAIDGLSVLTVIQEKWIKQILDNFEINLIQLAHNSNSLSFLDVFQRAIKLPKKEVIIFAEDDYLWCENAISELYHAFRELPADYITPYDHPVRYDQKFISPDYPHWENRLYHTLNYHYRSHESTCMTFASYNHTLRDDNLIFHKYCKPSQKCPNDREIFRELQHLGPYSDNKHPKRLLLGPIPSLATHVHLPYLAPTINWTKVAHDNLFFKINK